MPLKPSRLGSKDIGALPRPLSNYLFAGTAWNIIGIHTRADDFYVTGYFLSYATTKGVGVWRSSYITASRTELVAEVPQPVSLALLLASTGSLGALLRRRRQ